MSRFRVPLHIKVMVSYLLVVAFVVLPMVYYLQTKLEAELRNSVKRQMKGQLDILGERLAAAPVGEHSAVGSIILAAMPDRVTIIQPDGKVLLDSTKSPSQLENHGKRAEFRDALKSGYGYAERQSTTTKERRLYVARRYPLKGPAKGVVRLSMPVEELLGITSRASEFLKTAGALGLTAALILSLIAAFVVSKPLRTIATAARAFADGDFSHEVRVQTRDELEDAAEALQDLAVQLRETLVKAGAGRATLLALLDDLPCGVIIYSSDDQPVLVSAAARQLCELSGADEDARAQELAALPEQRAARASALSQARSTAAPLELPWAPNAQLRCAWINVYDPDGAGSAAAVITDQDLSNRHDELTRTLNGTVLLLRDALAASQNPDLRVNLESEAERLEDWASWSDGGPSEITPVALGELCEMAARQLQARAELKKVKLKFELPEEQTFVAEDRGRACRAIRGLLRQAVRSAKKGTTLSVLGARPKAGAVRLSVRTRGEGLVLEQVGKLAYKVGGKSGTKRLGDTTEAWLELPRA